MIWTIYKVEPQGIYDRLTRLGNVRAPHQPAALLRAMEKWRVNGSAEQRKLVARRKGVPLHIAA